MSWLKEADQKSKDLVRNYDDIYSKAIKVMDRNAYIHNLFRLRKTLTEMLNFEQTKNEYGRKEFKPSKERIAFAREKVIEIESEIATFSEANNVDEALKPQIEKIKIAVDSHSYKIRAWEKEAEALFEKYQTKILKAEIDCGRYYLSSQLTDDKVAKAVSKGLDRYDDNAFTILRKVAELKQNIAKEKGFTEESVLSNSVYSNNVSIETVRALQDGLKDNLKNAFPIVEKLHSKIDGEYLKSQRIRNVTSSKNSTLKYTIEEALLLISDAFKGVSEEMHEFVYEMVKNRYIDFEPREEKRCGACAKNFQEFLGHSIVLMSFNGNVEDVLTLAHELGHAYHYKVLKQINPAYRDYPLVFAETASMFAETVVLNYLIEKHKESDLAEYFELQSVIKFYDLTVMVPSRFDLEERIYKLQETNRLDADSFQVALVENQECWYPLHDNLDNYSAWMLVRHYFMPTTNFYNYPYYFGFILNQVLMKEKDKANFSEKWKSFLRATGDNNTQEAWQNIFGQDMTNKQFWNQAIDEMTNKIKTINI